MKQIAIPILTGLAKILSGATVRWIDCEPDTCQRVYFANHTSHLDALVLWSSLPKSIRTLTRPVAAADYWQGGPIRRYMATIFNVLMIDRVYVVLFPVETLRFFFDFCKHKKVFALQVSSAHWTSDVRCGSCAN